MEEQEPTMVSPAALAKTGVVETAPTAWSDTDELEEPEPYDDPRRRNWLISGVIFAATAAVAGLAAGGAYVFLHQDRTPAPQPVTTTVVESKALPPAPTTAPPPTTRAPIQLPVEYGHALVQTRSGKTACSVRADSVACYVQFVVPTPIRSGMPANIVGVRSNGLVEWAIGDPGQLHFGAMSYGTTYQALGWTITPTSDDTTFTNDVTGHGMTVSVENVRAF
ncbi:hypothetical protein [Mycobacteroides saopaulense]|uniref:Bacteriophage protein n=1 Tax=Mycobacteroides saopaulense TaxID=1578165 RepID=A0ABX3BZ30_9MYCO|nr:hypothetical protein [Mycobacteroides saopaulense]OHT87136.1 hypothetical protein BKG68_12780 [Mycobacteroides saopaulense]OHU08995.1 hypothetical protein BKG73_17475 [Mycobacteroides saopaulense]